MDNDVALHDAAVALLTAPDAPTDAPVEPATAPVPDPPTDAPVAEPAPVEAPTPVVDEEKALLADLEARRQARQQRQPQAPDTSALLAKIEALEAKLAAPQQNAAPDLRQLIAQHGEVEGLRRYGIDPLQFFDGFRKHAKGTDPNVGKALQTAEEAKATALELQRQAEEREAQRAEQMRVEQVRQTERAFLKVTEDPAAGLQFLHKMEPHIRLARTYAKIEALQAQNFDTDHLTDHQLAKLVDMDIRDEIRRLTGTDPGAATNTTTVPATDGAKGPAKPPASLTNDLASQSTGGARLGTEEERRAMAIRIIEQGVPEA